MPTLSRGASMITLLAMAVTGPGRRLGVEPGHAAVTSDAGRSFMDGGLGTTAFDRNDSGMQLGRLRLALSSPLGELWSGGAGPRE